MSLGMWRTFPVKRAQYGRMVQSLEEKVEEIFKTEWTGNRGSQESNGIRVLDVGTGSGASARILIKYLIHRDDDLWYNSEIHTVDKDPKPAMDLEELGNIGSHPIILACTGLAQDLQCSSDYFDIVLFFHTVHHMIFELTPVDDVFREMNRVLRDNGICVIVEPTRNGLIYT